ncbi:MAG: hypothetical protein V2I82_14000 [Halieaceae bacterium]|jgi:hypothetical protein|nr:hypothetical protein [Halieaceae bacterium]
MNAECEIRRLRSLQALGITALVARRPLPGAAPSQRLRLRQPPAAQPAGVAALPAPDRRGPATQPETPTISASKPRAPIAAAAALRESLKASPARPPDAAASVAGREVRASRGRTDTLPPSASGGATDGAAVAVSERFTLAVVAVAGRLWVEDLAEGVLAREQLELIRAMGAALLHPTLLESAPAVTQFDWPLHGNRQLDLGEAEAAATLTSFLSRQLDALELSEVIVLGEAAARRLRSIRLAAARRELPSTRELLAEPLRKREAWSLLRA